MLNNRRWRLILAGCLLAMSLASCGEPSPRPNPTAPGPAASPTPAATFTALPATPTDQPVPTTSASTSQPPTSNAATSPATPITTAPTVATTVAATTATAITTTLATSPSVAAASLTLLVTNSTGQHLSFVDPTKGVVAQVEVGIAPWGVALSPDKQKAYVATAEGLAVVDINAKKLLARLPYRAKVGAPGYGEYRAGGMGLAVSPDGKQVYVGVYLGSGPSQLEIFDTASQTNLGTVPVGLRPFQVLISRDGREVYSIDHDSFSVTVVDPLKLTARTLKVSPLGGNSLSAFDKPHYAVIRPQDGHLLLPVQGVVLVDLDPATGRYTTIPLHANTHQHGLAFTPDSSKLLIVGTGAAGEVTGGPSLEILDITSNKEDILPLDQPHENVAVSPDGRYAYLTGGYSFANGGWDGLTVVDLQTKTTRKLPVPARPLDIIVLLP